LRGVRFNWKADGKEDIGLVAEEVGEVVPEIVTYEQDGHDAQSLDCSRLIPVTIEPIKQQQSTIEQLKADGEAIRETIEAENRSLRVRVEVLEQKLAVG